MPWVDLDNGSTTLLRFIDDEAIQLGKCPTVQIALVRNVLLLFASSHLGMVSNVFEIFQDNRRAWKSVLDDPFGKDMSTIPVETRLLPRQLLQVSLGRLRSVGLQLSREAEITAVYFFPASIAEELSLAGHSRTAESQVNPDHLICARDDSRFRHIDNDMQPELSLAIDEVCGSNLAASITLAPFRHGEGKTYPARCRGKIDFLPSPVERIRMNIVTDRTELTLRHVDRLELGNRFTALQGFRYFLGICCFMFGFPGESRLQGLGCLDTGLDEQIRHQARTSLFGFMIRGVVQRTPFFSRWCQPYVQTALNASVNCRSVSCKTTACSGVGCSRILTVLSIQMPYHICQCFCKQEDCAPLALPVFPLVC